MDASSGIQIEAVCHTYAGADRPALENVNLTIERGSFFGLLGPNGAGKTTLISLMTGILPVQQGNITILGNHPIHHRATVQAMTGLVPQDYSYYPTLTGLENLQYFAGINGLRGRAARDRIERCAELCGMADVLRQRAKEYSGGLKRRLNLAIGLLNEPHVLYLDEPTVGIDARSRRLILDAIKALKTEGNTVIYTSHYMEEVEQLCDAVAVIDQGRVVVHDRVSELVKRDGEEGILIELHEPLTGTLMQHPLLASLTLRDRTLYGRLPSDDLLNVLEYLRVNGVAYRRMTYGSSPLEEVYLRLIQREAAV